MKICVISSTVFAVGPGGLKGYGGLEQIAWQTAGGLAAKGHQVSLVAPDGSSCPGVTVIPTGLAGQHGENHAFARYHAELPKFDAIIDSSWQKWAYVYKAQGGFKAPVLGVCHAPINTMYGRPPPVEKPCTVCISKDQAAHYEALFSPAQARVCYNGVDMDFYKPMTVRRSSRFLFLARFSTIKGPDLAIDACRQAGVGLDLVGDTSITNEPDFFAQCKEKCDGTQIKMVGPASRGECVHWFSQAHCFIHPNQRFREPFGLAPVEAMACGCPVIAWDYGAMRETVPTFLPVCKLVESFDELVEAVRELGELHRADRDRCREWASQFSVHNMVNRYEELCQEAIETGW